MLGHWPDYQVQVVEVKQRSYHALSLKVSLDYWQKSNLSSSSSDSHSYSDSSSSVLPLSPFDDLLFFLYAFSCTISVFAAFLFFVLLVINYIIVNGYRLDSFIDRGAETVSDNEFELLSRRSASHVIRSVGVWYEWLSSTSDGQYVD